MLGELAKHEVDTFESEYADMNWFKGKQKKHIDAMEKARARNKLGKRLLERLLPSLTHVLVQLQF